MTLEEAYKAGLKDGTRLWAPRLDKFGVQRVPLGKLLQKIDDTPLESFANGAYGHPESKAVVEASKWKGR